MVAKQGTVHRYASKIYKSDLRYATNMPDVLWATFHNTFQQWFWVAILDTFNMAAKLLQTKLRDVPWDYLDA